MTVDYFGTYFIRDGFDLTRLVNDDLFQPVRIFFQSRHYVSAVKLLMVAVSSLGFVEFGNVKENTFIKLLERYADLASVGVTAEELWGGDYRSIPATERLMPPGALSTGRGGRCRTSRFSGGSWR